MQLSEAPPSAARSGLRITRTNLEFTAPTLGRFHEFIVRRRVAISAVLFGTLGLRDVATGVVPHDLLDFRDAMTVVGLAGVLIGLALRSWAAGFLVKNDELTTTGPYALLRNPLYLGSFLMVIGFCMLIHDGLNLSVVAVLLPCLYIPKVLYEERLLAGLYPQQWQRYAAATPRFFPRRLTARPLAGWRFSQWIKSREFNAVLAAVAGLFLLKLLHDSHV
jgi:protein-S-isoprenylcysteine O-methyltransferase Ste14